MTSKAKFKSDAFEAIHSAAQGLYRASAIDKATVRDFDEYCLAPPVLVEKDYWLMHCLWVSRPARNRRRQCHGRCA